MSSSYLPDWTAGANYRSVVGTKGLFGKWSFSLDTPSLAAMASIAQYEESVGWPREVVDRNDLKRKAKRLLWVGPKGLSLGPRPIGDFVGKDAFSWLPSIRAAGNAARMSKFGNPSISLAIPAHYKAQNPEIYAAMMATGTSVNQLLAPQLLNGVSLDTSLWRDFFSTLTHVDLAQGAALASSPQTSPTSYFFDVPFLEGLVEPGFLVCAVLLEGRLVQSDVNSGHHRTVCFKCPSPAGMEGIRYLAYSTSYTQSWITTAYAAPFDTTELITPRLQAIGAESLWKYLIGAMAGVTVTDVVAGANLTIKQDLVSCKFRLYAPDRDVPVFDYPRLRVGGFPGTGISVHEVSAYGQPEFTECFHVLGNVTVNGAELKIDETEIVLDWLGDRLADLSAGSELTEDQRTRLTGMRVRSCVSSRQRTIAGPLVSKLSFAKDASKADVDLNTEVMFPADGEQPALTFAQAEKLAVGVNYRTLHQMMTKDSVLGYTHLEVRGSLATPATLGWDLWNGAVKTNVVDVDEALLFIREGGRVANGIAGTTLDAALEAVFGMPLSTFTSSEIDAQAVADFDEAKIFRDKAPNMDALSPSEYAGFSLMHFGRNRGQLDTFVTAAISYGRYAHKKLVGGEVIKKEADRTV